MVVFPHGTAPRVAVIPIGEPSAAACEAVAETLGETFGLSVPVRRPIETPTEGDPEGPNQRAFLERVATATDDELDLAVGVTDAELREHSSGPPLFGVGLEFGSCGVVSTVRLVEHAVPTDLERERLATETLSVVGVALGLRTLVHDGDADQSCAVAPGTARHQLDATAAAYCEECWNALTDGSTYPKPPAPDDWIVRPRGEAAVEEDRGGRSWTDYPLIPIALVVLAVVKAVALLGPVVERLPRPGTGSARDLPQPVHTIYRIVKFWTNVALYLGALVCWLFVTVSAHDRVFGPELSDAAAVGLLVASVALGVFSVWVLKGIVGGIYDGLRIVAAEEWE